MYGWYSLPFAAWFLGQSRGSCTGGVLGQGHTEQHHRMLEFATIEIHIIYIHMCVYDAMCINISYTVYIINGLYVCGVYPTRPADLPLSLRHVLRAKSWRTTLHREWPEQVDTSCLCLRFAQRQVVKHSSTGEKSSFCLSPSLASRKPWNTQIEF